MKRVLLLGYAALAYLSFVAIVGWAVTFVADLDIVSGIDHGPAAARGTAVAIDLALLGVFAVHHSLMARPAAKRALTRFVPQAAERSTYVLTADLLLALVLWQWRPVGPILWHVDTQPWRVLLWAGYLTGWVVAIASTFLIDHLDFVGLRQASAQTWARTHEPPRLTTRGLYTLVRHPIMLGLLIAFWVTPTLSVGHLLFATAGTAYVIVGIRFEEADLRRTLGARYVDYARRTPALLPVRRRAATGASAPVSREEAS
ncbi:isoprenylcysteine carboxylmethyltransferase family protein [Terrabacter sp. NPDC080008]|uniref:methyltransferase family protein n=1 Tax=Terrabacter sp. NPDC080008 TaxID=3155176 RepID=UPI00344CAC7F